MSHPGLCTAPRRYFTSKSGDLLRKNKANVTNEEILRAFSHRPKPKCEVVAVFISSSPSGAFLDNKWRAQPAVMSASASRLMRCGASEEEPGRSITTFEYLKAKDLSAFLKRPAKPDGSMLQRFVDPRGEYNTAIRADWSPQMLVLEQRENVCRLADQGLDHYQRVVTFEGAAHNSLSGAVKQHSTALRLRQACESIADHLATTGSRQARPLRMVLFFKVGTAARVCLRVRLLRDVLPLCM